MTEEDSDLITLVDEEGHDHQFSLVDMVELNEHRYALLMPIEGEEIGEDDEEEEEAYIFRLETDEKGTDTLVDIDDDEEFEQVRAAFEDEGDDDDEEDE